MIEKSQAYKSKRWLEAVHSIENCVLCGAYGIQAAHRNEGKGMGVKTSDALTAAICHACHFEIDHGKKLSRVERRALLDRAIVLTIEQLAKSGKIIAV